MKKSFDVIYQLVGQTLHGFVAGPCYMRRQNKIWTIEQSHKGMIGGSGSTLVTSNAAPEMYPAAPDPAR